MTKKRVVKRRSHVRRTKRGKVKVRKHRMCTRKKKRRHIPRTTLEGERYKNELLSLAKNKDEDVREAALKSLRQIELTKVRKDFGEDRSKALAKELSDFDEYVVIPKEESPLSLVPRRSAIFSSRNDRIRVLERRQKNKGKKIPPPPKKAPKEPLFVFTEEELFG